MKKAHKIIAGSAVAIMAAVLFEERQYIKYLWARRENKKAVRKLHREVRAAVYEVPEKSMQLGELFFEERKAIFEVLADNRGYGSGRRETFMEESKFLCINVLGMLMVEAIYQSYVDPKSPLSGNEQIEWYEFADELLQMRIRTAVMLRQLEFPIDPLVEFAKSA